MNRILFLLIAALFVSNAYSQNKPSYPEPAKGFKRVDLILPKIDNQKNYKVEVRFGMMYNKIECATADFSFLRTNLKEEYGIPGAAGRFPYYRLEGDGAEIQEGRQQGCESTNRVEAKILSVQNLMIEYQSSYPRPFYIPESWTLEYRIWNASDTYTTVGK